MTIRKKDGTLDKRVNQRARYIYPNEKASRGLNMEEYNDVKIHIDVPNINTFKSVQIDLTTWISVVKGTEQRELDFRLHMMRRGIKEKIRSWKQNYFNRESIVVIDTTSIVNLKPIQFFTIEITMFTTENAEFDRHTIISILEPFIQNIIDEDICSHQSIYCVTRNEKMDGRSRKIRQTIERKQSEGI